MQEKEKESWEAASQALNKKLEIAESNCIRAEIEAAKTRSIDISLTGLSYLISILYWDGDAFYFGTGQLELDLSVQNKMLNTKDAELVTAKEEVLFLIMLKVRGNRKVHKSCLWRLLTISGRNGRFLALLSSIWILLVYPKVNWTHPYI